MQRRKMKSIFLSVKTNSAGIYHWTCPLHLAVANYVSGADIRIGSRRAFRLLPLLIALQTGHKFAGSEPTLSDFCCCGPHPLHNSWSWSLTPEPTLDDSMGFTVLHCFQAKSNKGGILQGLSWGSWASGAWQRLHVLTHRHGEKKAWNLLPTLIWHTAQERCIFQTPVSWYLSGQVDFCWVPGCPILHHLGWPCSRRGAGHPLSVDMWSSMRGDEEWRFGMGGNDGRGYTWDAKWINCNK